MKSFGLMIVVAAATVLLLVLAALAGGDEGVMAAFLFGLLFATVWLGLLVFKSLWRAVPQKPATQRRPLLIDWCCWLGLAVPLACILLTVGIPGPWAPGAARRMACANNLRRIGLAMRAYSLKYGSYPPAYVADQQGRPTISWRVLLLPHMGEPEAAEAYKNIRLDEPWNSPHNLAATANKTVERFFHCPTAANPAGETSYVMVVGPDTISNGPRSKRPGDIKGSPAGTIMVVEIRGSGIHWAEPRDLDLKTMSFRVNDPRASGISSEHADGAFVLFGNGSTVYVFNRTDPKIIKAALNFGSGADARAFDY